MDAMFQFKVVYCYAAAVDDDAGAKLIVLF